MIDKQQQAMIEWYNRHAAHFVTQADKYLPLAQMNDFCRYVSPGDSVLDAGCGSGRDCNLLYKRGLLVTGIDLSTELLRVAKKLAPSVHFLEASLLHTPFQDQSFDGIWSHASLVHLATFDDARAAFKEFNRLLKPGGVLHLFVKANTINQDHEIVIDQRTGDTRFFRYYSMEQLEILADESGFEPIKMYQFKDKHGVKKYNHEIRWITFLGQKSIT